MRRLLPMLCVLGCFAAIGCKASQSLPEESVSGTLEIYGQVSRDRPNRTWNIPSWGHVDGSELPPVETDSRPMLTLADVSSVRLERREARISEYETVERDVLILSLTDAARERLRTAHHPGLRVSWPMIIKWRGRVVSATIVSQGFEFHSRGEVPMSMTEGDDPSVMLAELQAELASMEAGN